MLSNLAKRFRSSNVAAPAAQVTPEFRPSHLNDAAHKKKMEGIDEVIAFIEADLVRMAANVAATGKTMSDSIGNSMRLVDGIKSDTDHLSNETLKATSAAQQLASAVEELAQSNEEVGRQARNSSQLVHEAETIAATATTSIEDLKAAIGQIESVVKLISDVARQTNLLALNATIEAARAGTAGRGFAVVANEVKALSVETQKATDEITANIERLTRTSETSIAAVGRIIGIIGQIRPVFGTVASAVEEQIAVAAELGRGAHEGAAFAEDVAARTQAMREATSAAVEISRTVDQSSGAMQSAVADVNRRLIMLLRQTEQGDRRRHDRWPVSLKVDFKSVGGFLKGKTVDISEGGVLVQFDAGAKIVVGTRGALTIEGGTHIEARVVNVSSLGAHFCFDEENHSALAQVHDEVAKVATSYQAYIDRAQDGAREATAAMDEAIRQGRLSREMLFDTDYRVIPNTNPVQYNTRYMQVLEEVLTPIQERILNQDGRMTFTACVDRNGFLPVHNKKYAQPQRPHDPVWNAGNCRNKRIFDDRAGLLAARNTRPFLVQAYHRDMGGGNMVLVKEIDAPLYIGGKHWGGLRTAYRM
ncbi:MAG: PilZ domain-containing protein [Hyphomicrobiaceae bacterium]|nr:PilZ domain-containing protein [Hyphomicrobiaceae bacterium]